MCKQSTFEAGARARAAALSTSSSRGGGLLGVRRLHGVAGGGEGTRKLHRAAIGRAIGVGGGGDRGEGGGAAILFIARVAASHCVAEARSVPLWGAVPQFWMVASSIFLISGLI